MQHALLKPEHADYVKKQVTGGRFESPEAVIAAALDLFIKESEVGISPEMSAAIKESRGQIARGEGLDAREALLELRRKYEAK